jgi:hypothetical protein
LIISDNILTTSIYSKNALDLKDSEKEIIKEFFNKNQGQTKLDFAKKYLEIIEINEIIQETKPLSWIEEIKEIINN